LIKDVKKDVITCRELVKKLAKNVLKLLMIILCKKEKILNLSSEKIQNLPSKEKRAQFSESRNAVLPDANACAEVATTLVVHCLIQSMACAFIPAFGHGAE
jgi:hypothetical protein